MKNLTFKDTNQVGFDSFGLMSSYANVYEVADIEMVIELLEKAQKYALEAEQNENISEQDVSNAIYSDFDPIGEHRFDINETDSIHTEIREIQEQILINYKCAIA